jgi:hypothetical protein
MRYESVQRLSAEDFKRSTGVQRSTFAKMLEVVEQGLRNFGRPPKLGRADQLLLTLMYWREYRTEFYIGLAYGVSESAVCRTIKKIENALIKSEQFHLPNKKALQSDSMKFEITLVDATEQPIERPKKTAAALQRQKKVPYSESADNCRDGYGTDFCRRLLRRQET